ncbi:MAG: transposase [Chloroflexota bacterium]|nr:transposase [Chloroflexota bacterium]
MARTLLRVEMNLGLPPPGCKGCGSYFSVRMGIDREHEAVNHSISKYVRGQGHTNGMESFWTMPKRAHAGTLRKTSPKHLQRYVSEFAVKHNVHNSGTIALMRDTVARLVGCNLLWRDIIGGNELSNAGR